MKEFMDIISRWDHFGQGVFFLIVISAVLCSVNYMFKMLAVVVRGWPPVCEDEEEEGEV